MQPKSSNNTTLIGIIAVIILVAAVGGTILLRPKTTDDTSSNASQTTADNSLTSSEGSSSAPTANSFKDGTYSATGSYVSPGGTEEIDVTITVVSNKVTSSSVAPQAATRESMDYQDEFVSGYKNLVIGKDLASLRLSKVSGSSLTSRGFNDALEQIRKQAKV